MWYITLIDLQVLSHPYIPRINSTESVVYDSFYIVTFDFLIFSCRFLHPYYQRYWPVFFVVCLSGFGIRVIIVTL